MKGRIFKSAAVAVLTLASHLAHAGTVTYVYTDPQGTPLAEANASGTITATFDYKPYGSQVLGSPKAGPGYTGHVNDPDTGFVYMQARYYDPAVGRFLSVDPMGIGSKSVFDFNRYLYVNGNPIKNIDADGRSCGATTEVSATVQNMRNLSDGCGAASSTVVRAFNGGRKAYYIYADGGVVVNSGARPGRDNNPGDLRKGSSKAVSNKMASGWDFSPTAKGDTVTSKMPFAIFSTVSVGEDALAKTIRSVYGEKNISQTVLRFAPGSDHNNPAAYASILERETGISASRAMNDLSGDEMNGLVHAIEKAEGFRVPDSEMYHNDYGPFSNP